MRSCELTESNVAKSPEGTGSGGARASGKGQAAGIKRSANRWQATAFRFGGDGGRQAPKEPWAEAGSGGAGSDGSGCAVREKSKKAKKRVNGS
jgi:hypothetical protein